MNGLPLAAAPLALGFALMVLAEPTRADFVDTYFAVETGTTASVSTTQQQSCPTSSPCSLPPISGHADYNNGTNDYPEGRSFSSTAKTTTSSVSLDDVFHPPAGGIPVTLTPSLGVSTEAKGSGTATAQAGFSGAVITHMQGSAQISPSGTSIVFGNENLTYNITDGFTIRIDAHVEAPAAAAGLNADSSLRVDATAQLFTQSGVGHVATALIDGVWGVNGVTVAGTPKELVSGSFSGSNALFIDGSMLESTSTAVNTEVSGDLNFSLLLHAPGSLANTLALGPQVFSLAVELDAHSNGGFARIPNTLLDEPTSSYLDAADTFGIYQLSMLDSDGNVMPFFTFTSESGLVFNSPSPQVVAVVPVPATLPLFASGLGALGLLGWRRKRKQAAA